MQHVVLNNGVKMPILGFGVFQIPASETKQAVLDAIQVGYRHIDTAQSYANEKEVGEAIAASGIPREELFITSKVWLEHYGYEKTRQSVLASLEKMGLDYLDLMLLHQPFSDYYGSYRALEDLYKEGKLRAIGVSNFYPDRLSDLVAFNEITPQVNQVETHPFNQQIFAQENMVKNNVQIESWATFAEGRNNIFTNPVLVKIAEKYGKSTAQIMVRWQVERGIVCLTKSVKPERMAENIDVFDFSLSEEDMAEIVKLDTKESLFFNHQDASTVDMFLRLIEQRKNGGN
ncbi:aldo/keto reductase [Streptococcus ruminantium]|uniref:Aldo/keto reductase n=1 Tax=Streptococcus ruminantium TaxID=1917441 RepID=A0ABU1B573_9STRE|nr:aldo/keto reductase [Streptococcus ruminantium]MDQ8759852.1 aldo/keto reductase [Streptococcus ruminantium]MDQ8769187.1 aldo/keto reductase [Streptococcus ruminantium]MDQ8773818.1 aldo/keto reductase [Streptococcus ruminantium]MDQ8793557.1 aldo/keto reductase [Streptococcus ruminantium]MDQ8795049.1 aldo/keto reductase [Streptococcus ruminantium]